MLSVFVKVLSFMVSANISMLCFAGQEENLYDSIHRTNRMSSSESDEARTDILSCEIQELDQRHGHGTTAPQDLSHVVV